MEPSSEAEKAWVAACERFFVGNDAEVGKLIDVLQASDPSAERTALGLEQESALEMECGIAAAVASPETRTRYLKLKDAARATAHAAALRERRERFAARVRALPSSPNQPPCDWARVKAAVDALGAFSKEWRRTTGPPNALVLGLARLLRDQAASDHVLRWTVDAAAVYEAPPAFAEGFLDLLPAVHVLCASAEERLFLELDPAWSDRSLRRASAAAGSPSSKDATAHGAVAPTDRLRTNVDGELDERPPFLDRLLFGELEVLCPIL